jgi:hypothetical protein
MKRECNSQATSSSKKVAVGEHGLATSLARKALNKVSKFPRQLFQPSCLEEGTWKPQQNSLGTFPFPNSHFSMDNFFKRCHYMEFMY